MLEFQAALPHCTFYFADDVLWSMRTIKDSFEQSILDNLAKAGIQNGKRKERIHFAGLEPRDGLRRPGAPGGQVGQVRGDGGRGTGRDRRNVDRRVIPFV